MVRRSIDTDGYDWTYKIGDDYKDKDVLKKIDDDLRNKNIFRIYMQPAKGKKDKDARLNWMAIMLKRLNSQLSYKISARGWCYLLEGEGYFTKGEFERMQSMINDCRRKGFLPIDFVAEDKSREFEGLKTPDTKDVEDKFAGYLRSLLSADGWYVPDYWDGEEYYIMMVVEKVDLRNMFEPICRDYHIPIANMKGSPDLNSRALMAERFMQAEELGLKPVLLYCGDFDPFGKKISDAFIDNFKDIEAATGWNPENLIFHRFGLNRDYIDSHGLVWIDNLESGAGNNMAKMYGKNKVITEWIDEVGERKVEANAILRQPEEAENMCRNAIEEFLGQDAIGRFAYKEEIIQNQLDDFLERMEAMGPINKILDFIEEKQAAEKEREERIAKSISEAKEESDENTEADDEARDTEE
jgi:hypothetical protein